jgi:gentisate 1,2-dioxygenase
MSSPGAEDQRKAQADFYAGLEQLYLLPNWAREAESQVAHGPHAAAVPWLWKWSEVRPNILRTVSLVTPEDVERRAIGLINPRLRELGRRGATPTLTAAVQLIMPGEVAVSHHHTPAALRVIMEGKGAYTAVDGERCWMEPGDLILTPAWTFHDHKHEGEGPMIWLDGLDVPLIRSIDSNFFERYPGQRQQALTQPDSASTRRFASAGLRPAAFKWDKPYSPLTRYPWERTEQALQAMIEKEATPFDDLYLEYVNPLTGAAVMPSMGCYAQRLRPGVQTRSHRHNASAVYYVCRGSGYTTIEGKRFEWCQGDVLALPGWHWHAHANGSTTEDAYLISFTDEPLLKYLGIFREQSGE